MARSRDRRTRYLVVAVAALALAASAAADPPSKDGSPPSGTSRMVIYRDPVTGKLATPPPGALPAPSGVGAKAAGTPVERRGTTPGGGYIVDLNGRFTNTMRVTKDADGRSHVECGDGASAAR
jgi:hypothetical protein